MKSNVDFKRWIPFLGMLILIVFLAYIQLSLYYGKGIFYHGDDLNFHFLRISGLSDAIVSRSYPIYINNAFMHGYGYAVNWFYPDLFLLPAALMNLLRINLVTMYKLYIIIITILTAATMYFCTFKITKGHFSSVIATLLYTFSAYRTVDIYWRGAIGEYLAFIFIPLTLYGFYEIVYQDYKKWYYLVIGFTGLVYSHVLTTYITFFLLLILFFLSAKQFLKEKYRFYSILKAAGLTILLSSFYIFPMLEQSLSNNYHFMVNAFTVPAEQAIPLIKIIEGILPFSITGLDHYSYYGLGTILILPLFTRFFIKEKSSILSLADISVLLASILLFITSDIFPWKWLPFLDIIQFPWRLNTYITLFYSIACAIYLTYFLKSIQLKTIAIVLVSICQILFMLENSVFYIENNSSIVYNGSHPLKEQIAPFIIGAGQEYIPANMHIYDIQYRGAYTIFHQNSSTYFSDFYQNTKRVTFSISAIEGDAFELPLIHYKGYQATLNGESISLIRSVNGYVEIVVPPNSSGTVEVIYAGTLIQKISLFISCSALVVFIGYSILIFYKRKKLVA